MNLRKKSPVKVAKRSIVRYEVYTINPKSNYRALVEKGNLNTCIAAVTKYVVLGFKIELVPVEKVKKKPRPSTVGLFKYRVRFATEIQTDGFSDFRDRDFRTERAVVMVYAKNIKHAKMLAVKKAPTYRGSGRFGDFSRSWGVYNIKSVTRICKSPKM